MTKAVVIAVMQRGCFGVQTEHQYGQFFFPEKMTIIGHLH